MTRATGSDGPTTTDDPTANGRPDPPDLRAPVLGLAAWLGAVAGQLLPAEVALGAATLLIVGLLWGAVRSMLGPVTRRRAALTGTALLLTLLVSGLTAWLRVAEVGEGPVHELADERATARFEVRVSSDPVRREGRFGDFVVVRATLDQLDARGRRWRDVERPVLLIAPVSWSRVDLGDTVRAAGRLDRADGRDLAALIAVRGPPRVTDRPGAALRAAEAVRRSVRDAAAPGEGASRDPAGATSQAAALIPALVDGDDSGLVEETRTEFRTAGLTHLLAVSGTNLTLVVGALLLLARALGVRARGLLLVGAIGVVGFVLVARPEPSVLRAAAMGSVALLGMGSAGRGRGARALGVAVLVLVLVDPRLAVQAGFTLSVLATAGILFLAPGWRDALRGWLPRWAPWGTAEALAVPLAAQIVCTPVVAAISGQVSLVAVGANILAAPVVAPATVLGLLGGVLGVLWEPLGRPFGAGARWSAHWLVIVADRSAALPGAAVEWAADARGVAVLTVVCLAVAAAMPVVLSRRWAVVVGSAVSVLLVVVPLPTPGWPVDDWVLTACDVGQGDGLVLRVADGVGVVVDAGPDPVAIDRCLQRLGIRRVPVVVLTHFHADHVDGLPGVLRGREVGAIEVTSLSEPAGGARTVARQAAAARVPVRVAGLGEQVRVGDLRWEVLAPGGAPPTDSDSPPNDASLVLLVRARGLTLLLMGDEEPTSQQRLAERLAVRGVRRVDVLKVAHHGSAKQDADLIRSLHPRVAVISCGVDNDYGHPAPSTLRLLRSAGALVRRTDTDGDVALIGEGDGRLRVVGR